MMKEQPVWLDGLRFPAVASAQSLHAQVDVAVIGGGYTGLAAARTLARGGARVAVLEAQAFGAGASARNGGMVLTGLKLDAATLLKRYGHATAQRLFAASLASISCVEQIVADEQIACDFARSGHLVVASRPAHARALEQEQATLARAFGHATRFVPKHELSSEIGANVYHGGLVDEHSARIDPAHYLAGLAQAAQHAGACLHANTPAQRITRGAGGFTLDTPHGTLRANAVLVATGGYTGTATPGLQRRIVPLGSYSIATARLPDDLARSLIPFNRMVFDTRHLLAYYRLTPDGRMLFGGRAAFVPATSATVRESAAMLQRSMVNVFPQLRGVPVEYAWGGTLDVPFDMLPHTGQRDGMAFALGYAGHGVAMATYCGAQMAACLLGQPYDDVFERLPFPGAPLRLYNGKPWFLPLAGAWYRFLDWAT